MKEFRKYLRPSIMWFCGFVLTAATNACSAMAPSDEYTVEGGVATSVTGSVDVQMVMLDSLPGHTVYMPSDLTSIEADTLPIVVWGNGGCIDLGNAFGHFLTEVASHGYLVIANGHIGKIPDFFRNSDGNHPSPEEMQKIIEEAGPSLPKPNTSAQQLIDGIDWALEQDSSNGSNFYRKIKEDKVAVMGQSCGGLQAIKAGSDKRIDTVMVWNSGTFPKGDTSYMQAEASKADLKNIHSSIAYISGDETDIAFANAQADIPYLRHVPVFRAWQPGVGHSGTFNDINGGNFAKVAVAWLDWQLKGSDVAAQLFKTSKCGLCTDEAWVVEQAIE